MLGESEHKGNFDQLGGLKGFSADADPCFGIYAALVDNLDAENHGVQHQKNTESGDQIPEIAQGVVVNQG